MKIRHTLLALTTFLGAVLIAAVAVQIRAEVLEYREAQRLVASNGVREQLLLGAAALAEERSRTYAMLLDPAAPSDARAVLRNVRDRVDAIRTSVAGRIAADAALLGDPNASRASLAGVERDLTATRARADAALASSPEERRRFATRWLQESTRVIDEAVSLRLTLLQQERPQESAIRTEALLRYYGGLLSESIARNEALLTQALAGRSGLGVEELNAASGNIGRADLAWDMIGEQLNGPISDPVRSGALAARQHYSSTLEPLQRTLLGSFRGRSWAAIDAETWGNATAASLQRIAQFQQVLMQSTRERLDLALRRARNSVILWSLLLLAGIGAVAASILVVRKRIVVPLEALNHAMSRLAENDLATPLPRAARADEIGEMSDTLRVFKANAVRRDLLQQDKEMLHARLSETYRQLRRDLEAAASIQVAMLPAASEMGHVRYRGLFRPSSLIAGDTYNVVQRNDARIGFFQVDVAGHGAPAALISVASHHTLSQALLKSERGMQLEDIASQVNKDWPEDLPYFTMILGEIDISARRAALVQAGHPPPLHIGRDGSVRTVGEGGFPIGMLPAATYDRIVFDFHPGDRLLLYSDGLVDAENPNGEPFSEARLVDVVRSHAKRSTTALLDALDGVLQEWRGSETLDDDLSVLVLEGLTDTVVDTANERSPLGALS